MRTELFLKDIRHSDYTENFINEKIGILTEKMLHPDSDLHVIVRIEKDRQRTSNRHPIYHCEVMLKSGMSVKTYKAVRQDRNLFRAITSSFGALKIILGKTHDRIRNDRRRRRVPEFTTEFADLKIASNNPPP
jgi:ribosome-associated translation inhibitor RaiA